MRRPDFFIAAVILTLTVCLGFILLRPKGESDAAYVIIGGIIEAVLPLEGEMVLYEFGEVIIETGADGARFVNSSCRDKLCVHTGLIRARGRAAACLPNGVLLEIRGTSASGEPDAVIR